MWSLKEPWYIAYIPHILSTSGWFYMCVYVYMRTCTHVCIFITNIRISQSEYVAIAPYSSNTHQTMLVVSRALGGSKRWIHLGLCKLHHRSRGAQNWGFSFLDPPRALGNLGLHISISALAWRWGTCRRGLTGSPQTLFCLGSDSKPK